MASNDRPHGGDGRFIRSMTTVERDAKAAHLRSEGKTYRQIAETLGYSDKGEAWRGVQRAKADIARQPVEKLIETEAAQLDDLYAAALDILDREHIMVSHGKIVRGDNGEPLLDDAPRLAAIDRARQLRESYRKLHGADAPKQLSVALEQRLDLEAATVADAVTAALDALDLTPEQRAAATQAAQARLLSTAPENTD